MLRAAGGLAVPGRPHSAPGTVLVSVARRGIAFDVTHGLPIIMPGQQDVGPSWYEHACAFACMYYAGLRPGEVLALRDTELDVPEAAYYAQHHPQPTAEVSHQ